MSIFLQHQADITKLLKCVMLTWIMLLNPDIVTLLNLVFSFPNMVVLTHWGRATHICVGNLTIIGSDNGLSPGPRQVIIWTNAGILLIRPLGTNFNEMLIEIWTFSFMKMHLKVSSAKWRPFCLGFNVLRVFPVYIILWSMRYYICLDSTATQVDVTSM